MAAIAEGKHVLAFPSFGPERRGAPVQAFVRTSDKPVRIRAEVKEPDVVVVFETRLLTIVNVTLGLKEDGVIIVNSQRTPQEIKSEFGYRWTVATVDATAIAIETLGVRIVNTTMLGAVLKVTNLVRINSLEEPLKHRFGNRAAANLEACKKAYEATVIA